jgi:hypothetical protein
MADDSNPHPLTPRGHTLFKDGSISFVLSSSSSSLSLYLLVANFFCYVCNQRRQWGNMIKIYHEIKRWHFKDERQDPLCRNTEGLNSFWNNSGFKITEEILLRFFFCCNHCVSINSDYTNILNFFTTKELFGSFDLCCSLCFDSLSSAIVIWCFIHFCVRLFYFVLTVFLFLSWYLHSKYGLV